MATESLIVKNVTKTFILSRKQMKINQTTEKKLTAVDDVSFSTYRGEIFGLLGPNGAGKTTTLRCIATLIKPDKGEIIVDGIDIKNDVEVKRRDRKSTRLNSSHVRISYAVFCLKKKKKKQASPRHDKNQS